MKTIGYVLADFPALSETFVGNEIRAMGDRGHRVVPIIMHLLDGPAQPADRLLADRSVVLKDVSLAKAVAAAVRPSTGFGRALAFLAREHALPRHSLLINALKIASVARQHGCTHLHAHFAGGATAHAIVAGRWIGASVSFIGHGHDIYSEPEDLAAKLAAVDFAVGTCDDMVGDFEVLAPGIRAFRVPCGTDPAFFRPADDYGATDRFLAIGRLVEQKGYDDLLAALARTSPSVRLDIVGDGPLEPHLRAQTTRLGIDPGRLRWLGSRPSTWIAEHGSRYSALVAPFRMAPNGERDTGPVVIKEAMAMGLPVIGTRFMGIKEMITPATGFLVEPGDIDALARAIDRVAVMDLPARRTMGAAGRARVEQLFSLEGQAARLSSLVEAA